MTIDIQNMDLVNHSAVKIQGYEPKCPICLSTWSTNEGVQPWVLNCGHMICESCLMKHKLVTRKCHMCREKFKTRNKKYTFLIIN